MFETGKKDSYANQEYNAPLLTDWNKYFAEEKEKQLKQQIEQNNKNKKQAMDNFYNQFSSGKDFSTKFQDIFTAAITANQKELQNGKIIVFKSKNNNDKYLPFGSVESKDFSDKICEAIDKMLELYGINHKISECRIEYNNDRLQLSLSKQKKINEGFSISSNFATIIGKHVIVTDQEDKDQKDKYDKLAEVISILLEEPTQTIRNDIKPLEEYQTMSDVQINQEEEEEIIDQITSLLKQATYFLDIRRQQLSKNDIINPALLDQILNILSKYIPGLEGDQINLLSIGVKSPFINITGKNFTIVSKKQGDDITFLMMNYKENSKKQLKCPFLDLLTQTIYPNTKIQQDIGINQNETSQSNLGSVAAAAIGSASIGAGVNIYNKTGNNNIDINNTESSEVNRQE